MSGTQSVLLLLGEDCRTYREVSYIYVAATIIQVSSKMHENKLALQRAWGVRIVSRYLPL